MAKKTVYAELAEVFKVSRKKGETDQAHLSRLLSKADVELDDNDKLWNKLSDGVQEWINAAVDAKKEGTDLPLPGGFEALDSDTKSTKDGKKGKAKAVEEDDEDTDEDEDTDADEDDDEDEAPKKPSKKGKGKSKKVEAEDDDADEDDGDEDEKPTKKAKGKDKGGKAKAKANGKHKGDDEDNEDEKPKKKRAPRASAESFPLNAKIKIIKKDAHREGSSIQERFAKLKSGMTVKQVHETGFTALDLRCDVDRGNIEVVTK